MMGIFCVLLLLFPLKHHCRLNPVAAAETLTPAAGRGDGVQQPAVISLFVDRRFQFGKVLGTDAHQLLFENNLHHFIFHISPFIQ